MKYVITSFVKSLNTSLAIFVADCLGVPPPDKKVFVGPDYYIRDGIRVEKYFPPTFDKVTPSHPLWKYIEHYDIMMDLPYCFLYKEIHQYFSDSKFIHSIRPSDEWLSSLERYDMLHPTSVGNQQLWMFAGYPYNPPFKPFKWNQENRDRLINTYETHNQNVIDYFKDYPDNFVCVETPLDKQDSENVAKLLGIKTDKIIGHYNPNNVIRV